MWMLLQLLGRVPRRLIWDNEAGIGRGERHAEGVGAFAGTLATTLHRLKRHDPESKGLVERRNGYFESSFMPGRVFASPADSRVRGSISGSYLIVACGQGALARCPDQRHKRVSSKLRQCLEPQSI